jgi:(p)ppGpp synthase/HD superfamily hydrolase
MGRKSSSKNGLGPCFSEALAFAHDLHRKQRRKKSKIPYIAHLLAVTSLVIENGGDEDAAIAALLHDAVEDQGGPPTLRRIRAKFGKVVAEAVESCSDTDVRPKPPWRKRKEAYIASIAHKSKRALLVSLADKVHNARAILDDYKQHGEKLWTRFRGKRKGTLWYYRALADAFKGRKPRRLVIALETTVAEIEELAKLSDQRTIVTRSVARGAPFHDRRAK